MASKVLGLNSKSLGQGSICPPLQNGLLRMYNMRFCPYAQRALIALNLKNISYDVINVDLKHKPEWFLKKNPLGLVPTIEFEGEIVYESLVVCELIDKLYPSPPKLLPSEPVQAAKHKMIFAQLEKFSSSQIRALRSENPAETLKEGVKFCETLLGDNEYFGGASPSWPDYMMWPWFERIPVLEHITRADFLTPHPRLKRYLARMQEIPAIKATLRSLEYHIQFTESFLAGSPKYDIGLDESNL